MYSRGRLTLGAHLETPSPGSSTSSPSPVGTVPFPSSSSGSPRTGLLILDDWGLASLVGQGRHDLPEVLDDRYARCSTLLAGQIPVNRWPLSSDNQDENVATIKVRTRGRDATSARTMAVAGERGKWERGGRVSGTAGMRRPLQRGLGGLPPPRRGERSEPGRGRGRRILRGGGRVKPVRRSLRSDPRAVCDRNCPEPGRFAPAWAIQRGSKVPGCALGRLWAPFRAAISALCRHRSVFVAASARFLSSLVLPVRRLPRRCLPATAARRR